VLNHDFTDPEWGTRWLGDLYQDLSEEARKRYALHQTPEFVEAYILDRTLEPAIREFGFEQVRMIDPACGSGHFLLGGFERLLREWQRHMPDMPPAAQAQRALHGVAGVDLNPFAAEIAVAGDWPNPVGPSLSRSRAHRRRRHTRLYPFSTRCGKVRRDPRTSVICRRTLASDRRREGGPGAPGAFRGRACVRIAGASACCIRSDPHPLE
jgi:hypothetical protein